MSISKIKGKNVDVHLWTDVTLVEEPAQKQLENIAALPWVFHHVAVMADCHHGKGATVGSVIAMEGAVSPAAVGVDIGCGMGVVRTSLTSRDLPDNLKKLRHTIESLIPTGFNEHEEAVRWSEHEQTLHPDGRNLWDEFTGLTPEVQSMVGKARKQSGTLGGGNHFIEVCLDTDDRVNLMLHSGSRYIGNQLACIHMERAMRLTHNQALPDRELSVFLAGTPEMDAYRRDLYWAQRYALLNRRVMFALLREAVAYNFAGKEIAYDRGVLCHHNYVAEEVHFDKEVFVTRKGAIRAGKGEMGIIPGSMGTKSFVVRGLGNPDSFESASHGAGRRMSRTAARKKFTVEDLERQTKGIECIKDESVLDEIPSAYKDIEEVMRNQADLVEVVAELRQVLCVKGTDDKHLRRKRGDKWQKPARGGKRE